MKPALTSAQVARLEAAAEGRGTSVAELMENAGSALGAEALRWAAPGGRFVVVCGQGNNGGDGLVAARKLAEERRSVAVQLIGDSDKLKGEPRRNLERLRAAGVAASGELEVTPGAGDAVIDAVFGTGLNRPPQGQHAEAIERISGWRKAGAKVIAADVPSGLHTDTGRAFSPCVQADATVSFGQLKLGQVLEPGATLCGKLEVADIGLPDPSKEALPGPAAFLLDESDARERVPIRAADSHKGVYGHVLLVAGSWGKTGAAALAGLGALRAGVGLATIATRADAMISAMAHGPELMGTALTGEGALKLADLDRLAAAAEDKRSLVIGPGIAVGDETSALLGALLRRIDLPCVLDADGLNAVRGELGLLRQARAPLLLTPHPGEAARLLRRSTGDIQADRPAAVRTLAREANAVAVLKGARTLIGLPDGTVFVNPTGNPGMATAGSGDVLSGLCGGLLAQGLLPVDAAISGVYAHGLAGDLVSLRTGLAGLIASDLLEGLQEVWVRWRR